MWLQHGHSVWLGVSPGPRNVTFNQRYAWSEMSAASSRLDQCRGHSHTICVQWSASAVCCVWCSCHWRVMMTGTLVSWFLHLWSWLNAWWALLTVIVCKCRQTHCSVSQTFLHRYKVLLAVMPCMGHMLVTSQWSWLDMYSLLNSIDKLQVVIGRLSVGLIPLSWQSVCRWHWPWAQQLAATTYLLLSHRMPEHCTAWCCCLFTTVPCWLPVLEHCWVWITGP